MGKLEVRSWRGGNSGASVASALLPTSNFLLLTFEEARVFGDLDRAVPGEGVFDRAGQALAIEGGAGGHREGVGDQRRGLGDDEGIVVARERDLGEDSGQLVAAVVQAE